MKVKSLFCKLQKMIDEGKDNWEVVISRDEEGNGYSPLADISDSYKYLPDSGCHGEIKLRPEALTKTLIRAGYTQEDVAQGKGWKDAIILCPRG